MTAITRAQVSAAEWMLEVTYTGLTGQTRRGTYHLGCECGCSFAAEVHCSIHVVDDDELLQRYYAGELDRVTCPSCGREHRPSIARIIHDPRVPVLALVVPPELRHEEFELMADLWQQLAKEQADIPAYVKRMEIVYGSEALRALLDRRAAEGLGAAEDAAIAAERKQALDRQADALLVREEELALQQESLAAVLDDLQRRSGELDSDWEALQQERAALRALAVDLSSAADTRADIVALENGTAASDLAAASDLPFRESEDIAHEELELEGRPGAEIDRWRAGDELVGAFLNEGRVFLTARPGPTLEQFVSARPEVLVQLHRIDGFPLVMLAVLPGGVQAATEDNGLYCAFDPQLGDHQTLLRQLGEQFVLDLDLYDDESRAVATWEIRAPFAENVGYVLQRAGEMLQAAPASQITFDSALATFQSPDFDRLGQRQHHLSTEMFAQLPSPGVTRLALRIVKQWSEPSNEDYLILTKSYPLRPWRQLCARVLSRALEYGLWLDADLQRVARQEGLIGSVETLLRQQLAHFAEVTRPPATSDLDPLEEWDNWRQLRRQCEHHDVSLDGPTAQLAVASERRARRRIESIEDSTVGRADLGSASTEQLLAWLGDAEWRRDAALELCDRGIQSATQQVFTAVCGMRRREVATVIPAMIQLGSSARQCFERGLAQRRWFIRQGCALALGLNGGPAEALMLRGLLLAEPSGLWTEVARALGALGTEAVSVLADGASSCDDPDRERLARAMAQAALTSEGAVAVPERAAGVVVIVARLARRALAMVTGVRREDAVIRGTAAGPIATPFARFSQRFLAAVVRDVNVLNDEDIVDQEEELDDIDIVGQADLDEAVAAEPPDAVEASNTGSVQRDSPESLVPSRDAPASDTPVGRATLEVTEEDIIERSTEGSASD